jgi:hypothetical protein
MTDKNFSHLYSSDGEVSNSPLEYDGKPSLSPEALQNIFALMERARKADATKKNLARRAIVEFELKFARGELKRQ